MDVSITIPIQVPPGTSLDFRGSSVPHGYLLEDGSLISRSTYARLFEIIGTTYGAGDGSTTFKLPDSRGRTNIGRGQGSSLSDRSLAATGGAETHTLTESEMPSHTHSQQSHNHSQNPHDHTITMKGTGTTNPVAPLVTEGVGSFVTNTGSSTATNNATTAVNNNTGGGASHNNMQPFIVATKMIKY